HQLLGEVAAHAVAEDGDLRQDVDAGLEGRLLLAVLPDATVASAHPDDARAVHQDVLPREAREEVDPSRLYQTRQPANELVERDDVVAVVPQRRRDDRQRELRGLGEEIDVLVVHLGGKRRALLARLLEDGDRQRVAAFLLLELRQAKRRRESGWTPADDQDVDFQRFAVSRRFLLHPVF